MPAFFHPLTMTSAPFREVKKLNMFTSHIMQSFTNAHHQRSPLVQGGLKIPVLVTVTMELGNNNVQVMKKYKHLVNEHYKEPVNGQKFDDVTASVLKN